MENKAQRGHTDSKRLKEDSSPDVSGFRTRALTHFSLLSHEKGKHKRSDTSRIIWPINPDFEFWFPVPV